jgi:hypothetical protein
VSDLQFSLADRLSHLSGVAPGIEDMFGEYSRPFSEHRVVNSKGRIVDDLPPRLRRAQARITRAVEAFANVAAELEKLERGKS